MFELCEGRKMNISQNAIPEATLEAVARSLFRETSHYGFEQVDYLRFVNLLLDMSLKNNQIKVKFPTPPIDNMTPDNLTFPLISERVQIREYNDKLDRNNFEKWLKEKNGRYFLLSRVTAKISNITQLVESPDNIIGVITLADGQPIGVLAFLGQEQIQHKAELRKLIGETKYRGKGLAKEAARLWIQYGIHKLGIKKIYLNTLDTNIRNIKLNEELGFKVEGILRNECLIDGVYHDILKMGLWSEEFNIEEN